MKAEFIGESKHYTKGKVYEIKSKYCKVMNGRSSDVNNVIAVYNINDPAARYKFERTNVASIEGDENPNATSNVPYRTYVTIEDFFKDWKVLEL